MRFGSGQPKLGDVYRPSDESFDRGMKSHFDKLKEFMRRLEHHLKSQELDARQPRLAIEADGPANTKTCERTEGAATAVQAIHGDRCTTAQKVQDGPKTSISFGANAEPPDLPCREDVLVEDGATLPESCLPSLEMHSSTATGGLVPTGEASTATETNFNQPPLRFYTTKETDSEATSKEIHLRTSTPYASYESNVFQESNLLAAPYFRRVVETKSRQNRPFNPGGSQGHPRASPFLGSWRVLVCGEVIRAGAVG